MNSTAIKCCSCGKFITYAQMGKEVGPFESSVMTSFMASGGAYCEYIPDSELTREEINWTCRKCVEKERSEWPCNV